MNKKTSFLLICILLLIFTLPVSAEVLNTYEVESLPIKKVDSNEIEPLISGSGHSYKKEGVNTSYYWSSAARVSQNLNTNPPSNGGTITSDRTKTFSTNVSGEYRNLGFDIGKSVSSTIGHSLNVEPNKRVYMAYKVRYKVETGTRLKISNLTLRVVSRDRYRVETPMYGEFVLLNY